MTDTPKSSSEALPENSEEVAPEASKSPVLNDRSAEPGLPVGEMSSETPKSPSEEKKIPDDMPVNPYLDPDMPGGVPSVPGAPDTPVDPKDPMPSDDPAEPGIPTKDPSPDTTEPSS
jgi:hypothetical protein